MSWSRCVDAHELLEKRGAALVADESLNNLTWGAIDRSTSGGGDEPGYTFVTLDDAETSIAHAFVNHRKGHLVLGPMSTEHVDKLLAFLATEDTPFHVVEGPREAALTFARRWDQGAGCSHEIQINQGLYEVTRVQMPDVAGGQMVPATEENRGTLQKFLTGFCRDCFPNEAITPGTIHDRVHRLLAQERAFLWRSRDEELVSMAAIVRESPNTVSISLVYTPPAQRGRGHAARIVGALSQAQLDGGKKACNLHTDLANVISNGVYVRLGYEMIGRSARVRLIRAHQA